MQNVTCGTNGVGTVDIYSLQVGFNGYGHRASTNTTGNPPPLSDLTNPLDRSGAEHARNPDFVLDRHPRSGHYGQRLRLKYSSIERALCWCVSCAESQEESGITDVNINGPFPATRSIRRRIRFTGI